jgi:translocator assembly and maintenance protein 41
MSLQAAIKEGFRETFKEVMPEIRYAFAYGSAIQQQAGYDTVKMSKAMVDMMLVVPDTAAFHAANLQCNAGHYSWLMRNAASPVRQAVQRAGAGVFFNTDIPFQGRTAKYGIVSVDDFLADCQFWRKLYVAGRLQKPVGVGKSVV